MKKNTKYPLKSLQWVHPNIGDIRQNNGDAQLAMDEGAAGSWNEDPKKLRSFWRRKRLFVQVTHHEAGVKVGEPIKSIGGVYCDSSYG